MKKKKTYTLSKYKDGGLPSSQKGNKSKYRPSKGDNLDHNYITDPNIMKDFVQHLRLEELSSGKYLESDKFKNQKYPFGYHSGFPFGSAAKVGDWKIDQGKDDKGEYYSLYNYNPIGDSFYDRVYKKDISPYHPGDYSKEELYDFFEKDIIKPHKTGWELHDISKLPNINVPEKDFVRNWYNSEGAKTRYKNLGASEKEWNEFNEKINDNLDSLVIANKLKWIPNLYTGSEKAYYTPQFHALMDYYPYSRDTYGNSYTHEITHGTGTQHSEYHKKFINEVVDNYKTSDKRDPYIHSPAEVTGRIMRIREDLKLKPDEVVTPSLYKKRMEEFKKEFPKHKEEPLLYKINEEGIIKLLNGLAMNNQNNENIMVAKNGGLVKNPPPATTQDSLDVYNQAMKLYNYYHSKPDLYEYNKINDSENYQTYKNDYSNRNLTDYYNTNTGGISDNINDYKNNTFFEEGVFLGKYPEWEKSNNINTAKDLASLGENAEKVFKKYKYDSNKQPVYDYITGALDFAAPYMLEDKRIEPQGFASFKPASDEKNFTVYNPGNRVILPLYDPIKVYPNSKGPIPAEAIRMSKLLNNEKLFNNSANPTNYVPNMSTDWGAVLRAEGKDGSYNSRKKMYYEMGLDSEYGEYKGSAEQNLAALDRYRNPIKKTPPTSEEPLEPVKPIKETKMPKKSPYSIRIHGKDYPYSTKEEYYKIIKDKNLPKEWGDAYINPEVLQMKDGGLPYGQIGELAGQLTTLAPDKEYGYGMSAPTIAEGAVSKGLSLAGQGAALGNMVMPGLGTVIGAGLGFVGGAIAGGIGADKQQNQIEDAMSARKGNRTANPYGMVAEDGGMANTPMINIERGELEVDLATGEIIREFDKGYSKHSKNSKKEDPNNFVQAKPNTMIIPRKYAEEYKKNYKSRMGMIRDLANKQIDRELYGEDADGNKMEMSKLPEDVMMAKYGGIPMYYTGGIPPFNSIDLRSINNEFSNTFNNNPYPFPVEEPSMLAAEVLPQLDYGISGKYDNFLNMNLKDKMSYNPNKSVTENIKPEVINTSKVKKVGGKSKTESIWTTGNTIGAIGTGIGGLSPLITTLARGIDRDERNPFMGVENAAVNELEGVFRRGKARTMDEVSRSFNAANDYLSNTRMSGASRLANMQGLASRRANALASAGTNYDLLESRTKGQMRLQGDSLEAQGLERMDDRMDRNVDNFYYNVNQDLVNLGQNTAFFGSMLNKNENNEERLNILQQISPYYKMDKYGNVTYKGIPISEEEVQRIIQSVEGE